MATRYSVLFLEHKSGAALSLIISGVPENQSFEDVLFFASLKIMQYSHIPDVQNLYSLTPTLVLLTSCALLCTSRSSMKLVASTGLLELATVGI